MRLLIVSLRASGIGYRFVNRKIQQNSKGVFVCWFQGRVVFPQIIGVRTLPPHVAKRCAGAAQMTLFHFISSVEGRPALVRATVRVRVELLDGSVVSRVCVPSVAKFFVVNGRRFMADIVSVSGDDYSYRERPAPRFSVLSPVMYLGESVRVQSRRWNYGWEVKVYNVQLQRFDWVKEDFFPQ